MTYLITVGYLFISLICFVLLHEQHDYAKSHYIKELQGKTALASYYKYHVREYNLAGRIFIFPLRMLFLFLLVFGGMVIFNSIFIIGNVYSILFHKKGVK